MARKNLDALRISAVVAALLFYSLGVDGVKAQVSPDKSDASLYSVFVAINVKAEDRGAFLEACLAVGNATVEQEPGALRYEMLQDVSDSNRFYFYEIFSDQSTAEAHWASDHFQKWYGTVENMVVGEFETISVMHPCFPSRQVLEGGSSG